MQDLTFLREEYGPVPLYRWLQHGSTVVGSVVVATYGVRRLRGLPVADRPPEVRRPWLWLAALPATALAVGIGVRDPEAAVGAALLALLAIAGGWWVRVRLPADRARGREPA